MVAAEDDDGVVERAGLAEGVDEHADFVVDVGAVGKVGAAGALDVLFRHFAAHEFDQSEQALGVGVLLVLRDVVLGHGDVDVFVSIPVLLAGRVGICM